MTEKNEEAYKFWRESLQSAKFVLAPMVDQSELPWRMLTRKYGAQLAYTPMMHASVFLRDPTYRQENFTTCAGDRPLIAQFCTDDPDTFVQAAKIIEDQVDAVDLNLGCPQHIARRGHYGAFLQDEWDLIFEILSKAVKNLKVPVTAKIRVFEDIDKTVEYAKMIEKSGVSLLAVHGRTREQKGPDTGLASWKHIKAVKDAVKIPVFANGNILCFNDVLECIKQTGCEGVMIAEPNLYNPALFANINPPSWQMGKEYIEYVEQHPCSFACIRGHIFKVFYKVLERHTTIRDQVARIRDIEEMKAVIKEVEETIKADASYEEEDLKTDPVPYWRCQSHIRTLSSQVAMKENEQIVKTVECSNSQEAKKQLEEINSTLNDESVDEEKKAATLKLAKLLDRKRRKLERIERKMAYRAKSANQPVVPRPLRYVFCKTCKNPKGQNCEHELCRMCCKEKVFTQNVECKGHGLKVWRKPNDETNESQPDIVEQADDIKT